MCWTSSSCKRPVLELVAVVSVRGDHGSMHAEEDRMKSVFAAPELGIQICHADRHQMFCLLAEWLLAAGDREKNKVAVLESHRSAPVEENDPLIFHMLCDT